MRFLLNITKFLACFVILMVGLTACKKGSSHRKYPNNIYGMWQKPTGAYRHLYFNTNGSMTVVIADEDLNSTTYFGTFNVKADSLMFILTEKASKYINNAYQKTPLDKAVGLKNTYSVQNDSLILNTINYQADTPVITQAVFYRPVDEI